MYLFWKNLGNGKRPRKGSPLAAGFDLAAARDYIIPSGGRLLIKTDIKLKFPEGHYGRIADRSSIANCGLFTAAGVIDPDYTGEIKILMYNSTKAELYICAGEYIAQIIIEKFANPILVKAEDSQLWEEPALPIRGASGFGASDKTTNDLFPSEDELPPLVEQPIDIGQRVSRLMDRQAQRIVQEIWSRPGGTLVEPPPRCRTNFSRKFESPGLPEPQTVSPQNSTDEPSSLSDAQDGAVSDQSDAGSGK